MIIKNVKIRKYKNLNIDWDLSKSDNIVAVIGKNAAGKTNLLEALVGFSNVIDDSENTKINFEGSMELEINNNTIIISNNGIKQNVNVNLIDRKIQIVNENNDLSIPNIIRISIKDDFSPRVFNGQKRFLETEKSLSMFNELKYGDDFTSFLLYLFSYDKLCDARKILLDEFNIEKLYEATFSFNIKESDFEKLPSEIKRYIKGIYIYLIKKGVKDLTKFTLKNEDMKAFPYLFGNNESFFQAFHALLTPTSKNSPVLTCENMTVVENDKSLDISNLSDGEKQLIYILSIMLYFTGKDVVLLLDEPDTHIYPNLQMDFVNYLKKINNKMNIIIVTHSPYIVTSLEKENVFCIDHGEIFNVSNTKGKDINSIMSEIFNTPIRPIETFKKIDELYDIIENKTIKKEQIEKFKKDLNVLENELGEEDSDVITLKTLYNSREDI